MVSKEVPIHSAAERDEVAREAEILSSVSHPNVIQFYSLHRAGPKMSIVMEYADDGDVEKKILKRKPKQLHFPPSVVSQWTMQLLQALDYLHKRGFIHRDVKTANLFVTTSSYLKLGDFGVAKLLDRNAPSIGSRTAATPVGASYRIVW
jgi:serine/threonine protein kinase